MRRAAIGGSLVLIAVALAVVLFGGGQEDDGEDFVPGPPQTFVLDADAGGAVLMKTGRVVGVAANGDVKWSLPTPKGNEPFAVCLRSCPRAEVAFARSSTEPPERPDGPRRRLGPPSWKPVTVGPRLRVDRPLLGGQVPLRVTVDRAGAKPRLRVAGGPSARSAGTVLIPVEAADQRTGFIVDFAGGRGQRAMVLRRRAGGWSVAAQQRLSPPGNSTCISPDGSRIGLVGQGPPRVARVAGGRIGRPRTVTGVRREESNAGACALGGDTVATAVLSTGQGGDRVVIRVHTGRRVHTLRLRPRGGPFYDMWVSPRTGTTAVRIGPEVRLIDPDGQAKTLPAEVATVSAPGKLLLIPRRGRARTRRF